MKLRAAREAARSAVGVDRMGRQADQSWKAMPETMAPVSEQAM